MRWLFHISVVVVLAGCVDEAFAQPAVQTNPDAASADLVIRSWGTEAGLPQNTVNAIAQTRDGYLWLGTGEGLARFDGARFTVFGIREGLPSINVQKLFVDRRGTLWIGTGGGGLARMTRGRMEPQAFPQGLLASDIISALTEDSAGRLWVGTRAGLAQWDGTQFALEGALPRLNRTAINAFLADQKGGMWIATAREGLFEFRDQRLFERPGPPGDEHILAYCLLEDQQSNIWASVGNGKVLRLRDGQWMQYNETNGLPFAYVTSLAQENKGTLWAGSLDDGLYRFADGKFSAIREQNGLSANDIRSLFPDREDNLWAGTRTAGLNRLSHRKIISYGAAQGLTNAFTRSVAETADGTLWVGTYGGGLNTGGPGGFRQTVSEAPGFRYAFVDSVLSTPDGSVWYGAGRGLFRLLDGKLVNAYTNMSWVHSGAVTALCDDRRGGIWIGTSESKLIHFVGGEFIEFPHRVTRGPVVALAQQSDGYLWVGSEAGGLKRLRNENEAVLAPTNGLLSQAIRTFYLESNGTLWIGTAGGGLARWHDGRVTSFTTRQGLWADTISQIVEDDYGSLWLGCSHGVFRVSKAELNDVADGKAKFVHPRVFGVNDGMPAEECSSGFSPAGLKTRSGMICFSTVKGLVLLDPRKPDDNAPPPQVLLEEVLVNGQVLSAGSRSARMVADFETANHLTIPPGGREVELHYTSIRFDAPENVRFRYRLDGLDQDWIESGTRRVAYYQHVPAGDFVFRVNACDADGVWSGEVTMLEITVEPYLWEKTWFRLAAGAAGLGLLAGAVRLVERRRYHRRLALLETQHAVERERLRISQDMHDDVGSILTQVSQLSDLGQTENREREPAHGQFERIGQKARSAVQALDEIVWATNPKNDNLPRFAEYICRFADECFEAAALRCWQEVPTNLPNLPLRADVRHDVFLAVKEALNNVLKHSGATEVWLRLEMQGNFVRLGVEDNGRGFMPGKTAPGGNGLENMKMRLEECGGHLDLRSSPGQGTKIWLIFPLPKGD